ncbi:DUF3108 domain-containing protein [Candidatus Poribacteria bacterium]|nr:DUF3108 domain-containing protein [Candidatus Poribacteria bacterium]
MVPNKSGVVGRAALIVIALSAVLAFCARVTSGEDYPFTARSCLSSTSMREIPEGKYLYEFTWNGVPSATGEVTISAENEGGQPFYYISGTARTSAFADLFWRFRANALAVVDASSGRAKSIHVFDQENARIKETETVFNYEAAEAYYQRWKKGKVRQKTLSLEHDTIDPAALGLILSRQPLKVGDCNAMTVLVGDDSYALEYRVTAHERVFAGESEFNALRVEPTFHIIEEKRNKPPKVRQMTVWLSESEPRIPLKMRSKTFIGHVTCELVGVIHEPSEIPPGTPNG